MEVYGVIYLFINAINDMEYVGQTTRSVEQRFKEHAKDPYYIGNANRTHGTENFVLAVLKVCYSKAELNFWEKHFIKSRDSMAPNGYNLKEGGKGGKMSKETCKKMSVSHTGKKRSPEAVAKTAMSRRGIPLSLEHRAKLSVANTGKKLSKEHRAKIGVKLKGIPKSPEHRAKIGASQKGKKRMPETVAKAAAAQRSDTPYKNLLSVITEQKLSYSDLDRLLGLSQAAFSHKMRGKTNFKEQDVVKLVEIFNKPAEYLLQRDDGLKGITSEAKRHARLSAARYNSSPFKNLIYEMDRLQFSCASLAKPLELDASQISRKIRGKVRFTEKDIAKLVEIFGKPADYLMKRDDTE